MLIFKVNNKQKQTGMIENMACDLRTVIKNLKIKGGTG
jgi:hypothetical protein